MKNMVIYSTLPVLLTSVLMQTTAYAQTAPDGGTLQQLNKPELTVPKESKAITIQAPAKKIVKSGGPETVVTSIELTGNSIFETEALLSVLGEYKEKNFDLSELKSLSDKITDFYRDHGYAFASAILPAQKMENGILKIRIIEGRFGAIRTVSRDDTAAASQKYLNGLKSGEVITSDALERATLLLDDMPGLKTTPLIRPGKEPGTGDLVIKTEKDDPYSGSVAINNHGNRYTGQLQTAGSLNINSPFMLGDQVALSAIYTDEKMLYGGIGYNAPLGTDGLRGSVNYTHSDYQLAKEYTSLDAFGGTDTFSAGLRYPIIRSQRLNMNISGAYQYKVMTDVTNSTTTTKRKYSKSIPLSLDFDLRDALAGGGLTYGSVGWTSGALDLDSGLSVTDSITAKTKGIYHKLNLDLARIQSLPAGLQMFGRVSAQKAFENLDSSEGFGAGGSSGVRAYPGGEAYGNEGWLAQLELRYPQEILTPFVFYDLGWARTNYSPWTSGDNNRSIGGGGIGVRLNYEQITGEVTVAWRTKGGKPLSDSRHTDPRILVNMGYNF